MQELVGKLGNNFLIAALVPALAFVTLTMIVFEPIMPPEIPYKIQDTLAPVGQNGILLLIMTIVLGFTLWSLNTYIYKLLEGYHLLARLKCGRRRQIRKRQKLLDQLKKVEDEIAHFQAHPDYKRSTLQELRDLQYYIMAELDLRFPPAEQAILPTGFGNILRAAEAYSADRYGIDAVRLWPRLVQVIPPSYYDKVDQSNNGLAFLVNCSILSLLFGVLCVLAAGYQGLVWYLCQAGKPKVLYFVPIDYPIEVYQQRLYIYLVIFGLALLLSGFFYKGTFPLVMQYGNMIRSSFDLFRFELLKQFKLELPPDSKREYDLWKKISEFIAIGERLGSLNFEYQFAADSKDESGSRQ